MKDFGVIGGRTGGEVGRGQRGGDGDVLFDERVVEPSCKAVHISHHARRSVEDLKEVA